MNENYSLVYFRLHQNIYSRNQKTNDDKCMIYHIYVIYASITYTYTYICPHLTLQYKKKYLEKVSRYGMKEEGKQEKHAEPS